MNTPPLDERNDATIHLKLCHPLISDTILMNAFNS